MMSVKDKSWYPILFMFLISMFCASILVGFAAFTRAKVDANAQIAFERAAIEVLPLDLPGRMSPEEVHAKFVKLLADPDSSSAGALRYMKNGKLTTYVLAIEGQGFWAPIKGVIGINADKRTITGVSFYVQEETPGLGGEIVKPRFKKQFIGKTISEGMLPLEMRSSGALTDKHSFNAVTGATQTSKRLAEFMNAQLVRWRDRMNEFDGKETDNAGE